MNKYYIGKSINDNKVEITSWSRVRDTSFDFMQKEIAKKYIQHYELLNEYLRKEMCKMDFKNIIDSDKKVYYAIWPNTCKCRVSMHYDKYILEDSCKRMYEYGNIVPEYIYYGISVEPSNFLNNVKLFKDKDFFVRWDDYLLDDLDCRFGYVNTIENYLQIDRIAVPKFIIYGNEVKFYLKSCIEIDYREE